MNVELNSTSIGEVFIMDFFKKKNSIKSSISKYQFVFRSFAVRAVRLFLWTSYKKSFFDPILSWKIWHTNMYVNLRRGFCAQQPLNILIYYIVRFFVSNGAGKQDEWIWVLSLFVYRIAVASCKIGHYHFDVVIYYVTIMYNCNTYVEFL